MDLSNEKRIEIMARAKKIIALIQHPNTPINEVAAGMLALRRLTTKYEFLELEQANEKIESLFTSHKFYHGKSIRKWRRSIAHSSACCFDVRFFEHHTEGLHPSLYWYYVGTKTAVDLAEYMFTSICYEAQLKSKIEKRKTNGLIIPEYLDGFAEGFRKAVYFQIEAQKKDKKDEMCRDICLTGLEAFVEKEFGGAKIRHIDHPKSMTKSVMLGFMEGEKVFENKQLTHAGATQ